MILNMVILIVGFILLIKGADFFVDGASSTALNFKVSKMLVGLTIVAFGTSAPEFAVSMSALASGNSDMVLGNVIGSCILNILLILGIAAVIKPIKMKDNTVTKELPMALLITVLLAVLMWDSALGNGINQITRSDGIVILLFFTVFVYYLISLAKQKKEKADDEEMFGLGKSLLFVGIGLLGIIYGSDLVVDSASAIAKLLGISERVISLSIVAFGTSLPELVTTVVSSKKGEQDLLLGNIIGSNIFNICVVLGVPVVIYGGIIPSSFQGLDLIVMVLAALLLYVFAKSNKSVLLKWQGIFMLAVFVIYYTVVFVI